MQKHSGCVNLPSTQWCPQAGLLAITDINAASIFCPNIPKTYAQYFKIFFPFFLNDRQLGTKKKQTQCARAYSQGPPKNVSIITDGNA